MGFTPCYSSKVDCYNGSPTLFINDIPVPAVMAFADPCYAGDFARADIHIFNPNLGLIKWWLGPNNYDFSGLDAFIDEYLDSDTDALFIPRISLGYAEADWWKDAYPDQLTKALSIESEEHVFRFGTEESRHQGSCHSFASKTWLKEAADAITALIRHIEASKYGDHVVGYHVGGGITTEWFAWNTFQYDLCEDYSHCMIDWFRDWLRQRYGSVQALRASWKDEKVTFKTAGLPAPREIAGRQRGYLTTNRQVTDFLHCFSDATAAAIEKMTLAAKDASGWKKVVGLFYGYAWPHWNVANPARSGHAAMSRVFSLPSVDFIISPYHYDRRGAGGYNGPQTLPDAIAARGKLYISEIDTFTHLARRRTPKWVSVLSPPENEKGSVELIKRDFAAAASLHAGYWWMDVVRLGWFDSPAIMELVGKLKEAEDRLFQEQWKPVAQAAVVFSPDSCIRQRLLSPVPQWYLSVFRQWSLSRMGSPFDAVLMDDLLSGRKKDYKLYIFPNSYYLNDEDRKRLRRLLESQNAWALWFHAPGYLTDSCASTGNSSELTGIKLREASASSGTVTFSRSSSQLLKNIRQGTCCGVGCGLSEIGRYSHCDDFDVIALPEPVVAVDDPEAQVLGFLDDGITPGLAVKPAGGRADIFSYAPALPWRFMRNLLLASGCHVWCMTGDVVYADNRFAAVHACTTGNKMVHLPFRSDVQDLLTSELLAGNALSVEFIMKKGETRLLKFVY